MRSAKSNEIKLVLREAETQVYVKRGILHCGKVFGDTEGTISVRLPFPAIP